LRRRNTQLAITILALLLLANLSIPTLASWTYQTSIQDDVGDSSCRQSYTDIVAIYYGYNNTHIYVKYVVNGPIPDTSRRTVTYNVKFNLDPDNNTGQNGKWDYLVRYKVKSTGRTWSLYKWNSTTGEWGKIDKGSSTAYVNGGNLTIIIDKTVLKGLKSGLTFYPQVRMKRGSTTVKCDDIPVDPVPVPEPGTLTAITILAAILAVILYKRHTQTA